MCMSPALCFNELMSAAAAARLTVITVIYMTSKHLARLNRVTAYLHLKRATRQNRNAVVDESTKLSV